MQPRMPLTPIDPNRPLKKELTSWQRCEIQTYRNIGLINEHISRLTFCTSGTVATTIQLNKRRNQDETLIRSGRSSTLLRWDRRLILHII
jgi:hypothetical protein